jgi:alanine racemase
VTHRWAWAEVDRSAIRANVEMLCGVAAPAELWAVVKADGYGHGAVPAAQAALAGGATGLCVALVQEGVELRAAGIDSPILVLSEQPPEQMGEALAAGLQLTVYSTDAIDAITAPHHPVHLKVDTGMHRVGCRPDQAVSLARHVIDRRLRLAGVFSHLAVADEPDNPYNERQFEAFDTVLGSMAAAGIEPGLVHLANSAGLLAHPTARRAMVRAGIAVYGLLPGPGIAPHMETLRPAMSLHARVRHVQRLTAGERLSYGLRHTFADDATVATVPIGYADGVPRRLSAFGGEVLLGGRRRRIVGAVTMDQMMIDCGDDEVAVGDLATVIGRQGDETITADELAQRVGTIGYEIVCGISKRIARRLIN